ncbi:enoyl-CoA hydratase-related protein [Variovorax sp. J22P271]|uniref:enoyl-CoA hydratase-related protein n=1 Tax=Variovorax davisae TaxID=3053515 RepID=UPI002577EE63|nr:enoyl-CoA hydratase-related protein [Variovorax sp. J22P271]MDM0032422.1 enoyl-CoA hydratase-related protein [Variovorax sp. J22P271]
MELHVTESSIADGVGLVRLKRPDRGNSWTHRMNAEYRWLMKSLDENPEVRVIVVTGAGRQFCVGADFKALEHHKDSKSNYVAESRQEALARPGHGVHPEFDHEMVWHWGLAKPVIAAVNGACAGIAVGLAAFCDFRYAAAGAKFTTSTPKLGLPAEYGLSWVLPRLIGLSNAVDILFTGRVLLAEEMRSMGFLHGVLPSEDFEAQVLTRARQMAASVSPIAVKTAKRQVYAEQMHLEPGRAVEDSKKLTGTLLKLPDLKEGIAAAQERRNPRFPPL